MTNFKRTPFSEITRQLESKNNSRQTAGISSALEKALFNQSKLLHGRKLDSSLKQKVSHFNNRNSQLITSINKKFKTKSSIDISKIAKSSFKPKKPSNCESSSSFVIYDDDNRAKNSNLETVSKVKKFKTQSKKINSLFNDSNVLSENGKLEDTLSKPLSSQFETQLIKIKTIDSVLNYDQPIKSMSKLSSKEKEKNTIFLINDITDFGKTFKIVILESEIGIEKEEIMVGLVSIKDSCWVNLKIGDSLLLGTDFFEHEVNGEKIKFYYRWFKLV